MIQRTSRYLQFVLVLLTAILYLAIPAQALQQGKVTWQGKVVGISDGDTISVMREGKAERVRLYGVDTPESHEDFGTRAKQFSSDLVFGKTVQVQVMDVDRYGRTVGLVKLDGGKSLNEELIRAGFA